MSEVNSVQPSIIHGHLLALHDAAKGCLLLATQAHQASLGRILQLDVDIKEWELRISSRPESQMIANARRELGFATYSASIGLYLQAFSNLRLFLELSFAAVQFSANELLRRQWTADRHDFSWRKALDAETGILSTSFVREFHPAAVSEATLYAAGAAECYRQCSQFIHGKIAATKVLPQTLSYSDEILQTWHQAARKAAESVLFLLYCRYSEELLPGDDGTLAATLEYSFSHHRSVRESLGLPLEKAEHANAG